jgi:hypothetical protein
MDAMKTRRAYDGKTYTDLRLIRFGVLEKSKAKAEQEEHETHAPLLDDEPVDAIIEPSSTKAAQAAPKKESEPAAPASEQLSLFGDDGGGGAAKRKRPQFKDI